MLQQTVPLRQRVADHYVAKGYDVHLDVRVRGASGAIHPVQMVVQGRLGALVVAFPDEGGFDGPELGGIRRVAKDLGATPVYAAELIPPGVEAIATRLGVVLLDAVRLEHHAPIGREIVERTVQVPERQETPTSSAAGGEWHPWPQHGQRREVVEGRMQAVDVDQLLDLYAGADIAPPSLTEQTLSRVSDDALWKFPRAGTAPRAAAAPGQNEVAGTTAQPSAAATPPSLPGSGARFGWLDRRLGARDVPLPGPPPGRNTGPPPTAYAPPPGADAAAPLPGAATMALHGASSLLPPPGATLPPSRAATLPPSAAYAPTSPSVPAARSPPSLDGARESQMMPGFPLTPDEVKEQRMRREREARRAKDDVRASLFGRREWLAGLADAPRGGSPTAAEPGHGGDMSRRFRPPATPLDDLAPRLRRPADASSHRPLMTPNQALRALLSGTAGALVLFLIYVLLL